MAPPQASFTRATPAMAASSRTSSVDTELTVEEFLLALPPPLTDPATTLALAELDAAVPPELNPFTLVRVPGDELSIREAEEADEGWGTMDIWAVDVPGQGTATRDVLGVVRGLASGDCDNDRDDDEGMRHLKRVRKGKNAAADDGGIPCASKSEFWVEERRRS